VTIYTIGHSTRDLDHFLALLQREGVQRLADVRTFPASRRVPHFNRDPLARSLAEAGVTYSHHPRLGGRRAASAESRNTGWRNAGFRGYADYMEGAEFAAGLDELLVVAAEAPTAIMCAEAVPWRCHRSLIADALTVRGLDVRHILDTATRPHVLTSFAVVRDGRISYPPSDDAASPQTELFEKPGPRRV
jgi:uncharacterized protein (DUF488 family)